MSLTDEYRRQLAWRDWPRALDALPPLAGRLVLDLGCGPGDVAALLVERGARVVGIDANVELLEAARALGLPGAEFRRADLAELGDLGLAADGIWCSFAAAYFTDLAPALSAWARHLSPGGWIALTEVDDLFAHEPLPAPARERLERYAEDALRAGRYDFRKGRRLAAELARAGLVLESTLELADGELAFDGPAQPAVLDAWRARLERMRLLREACGADFGALRDAFLACLASREHRSSARVVFCLARR